MVFRAVLVGCGRMAAGWLRALQESPGLKGRVEIVGLVDVDPAAAERLKAEFHLDCPTGTDLEAMLGQARPDLLFDIVVPSARHQVVLTGLRHGCHVLTEKPMATSLKEARDMVEAARLAGRIHAVVQNRRFVEGVRRIRRAVAEGVIGELTGIHADFFVGAHFGGFREEMLDVLLLDMAIHTFDAARFMSGQQPVAVYCQESNPRGSWYRHGAAANAIFELGEGVVFTYRGSWVAEGGRTSWESTWRVIGRRGTLLWDGGEGLRAEIAVDGTELLRPTRDVPVPPAADPRQVNGHASVIAEFLDAIEAGRQPETAGSDNINSLAMVLGAIESARTQSRVEIKA